MFIKDLITFNSTQINVTKDEEPQQLFLLSGHILCKESIVIMKKFDFKILAYLYVLRSPEFMHAIFTVMYVCMYVSEHDSV